MDLKEILSKYSDSDIADKVGIHRSYVWLIRNNKRKPKIELRNRIVRAFNYIV